MFYHTSLPNFLELCLDNWLSLRLTVHTTSKLKIPNNILGTFSTISSLDKGTPESRKAATINGFINEFAGSFVLFFGALGLTKHFLVQRLQVLLKKLLLNKEGVFDATTSAAKLALSQAHRFRFRELLTWLLVSLLWLLLRHLEEGRTKTPGNWDTRPVT